MKSEIYNLQIPIDKNLESLLKKLADEDDRALRNYCKKVLQEHVKNKGVVETVSKEVKVSKKSNDVITEKSLEENKTKIKGFNR